MTIFLAMPAAWTDIPLILITILLIWIFLEPLSDLTFQSYLYLAGVRMQKSLKESLHVDASARVAHAWFWGN